VLAEPEQEVLAEPEQEVLAEPEPAERAERAVVRGAVPARPDDNPEARREPQPPQRETSGAKR
jgi:hypothetical protein